MTITFGGWAADFKATQEAVTKSIASLTAHKWI
jgi:hypothetical protein